MTGNYPRPAHLVPPHAHSLVAPCQNEEVSIPSRLLRNMLTATVAFMLLCVSIVGVFYAERKKREVAASIPQANCAELEDVGNKTLVVLDQVGAAAVELTRAGLRITHVIPVLACPHSCGVSTT